jgi:hypothetical protein
LETVAPALEKPSKTFAQVVVEEDFSPIQLLSRVVIRDTVRIKISPRGYATGMNKCKTHLYGRVTLQRNDCSSNHATASQQVVQSLVNSQQLDY